MHHMFFWIAISSNFVTSTPTYKPQQTIYHGHTCVLKAVVGTISLRLLAKVKQGPYYYKHENGPHVISIFEPCKVVK